MAARMSSIIEEMKANIAKMENMLDAHRDRIERMSPEVVDSNPYSRLMALERLKIVKEYERIREKTVAIVGVGGVGSVAADMLTRCGVGKLILFDGDKVDLADMNRLFFAPNQVGLSKVEAAAHTLAFINPDVRIETHNYDISTVENDDRFLATIMECGTVAGQPVDLVISCVGNVEARMVINAACNERNLNWFESGVSENGVSGHIRFIRPGDTACLACAPFLLVAAHCDEETLKQEGVCAASLPTTMGITAGCLAQSALKYLLNFGEVSDHLDYDALNDLFPKKTLEPNPECEDRNCLIRQKEFQARLQPVQIKEEVVGDEPQHAIELVAEEPAKVLEVGKGLELPCEAPEKSSENEEAASAPPADEVSLEDLMAQLELM